MWEFFFFRKLGVDIDYFFFFSYLLFYYLKKKRVTGYTLVYRIENILITGIRLGKKNKKKTQCCCVCVCVQFLGVDF